MKKVKQNPFQKKYNYFELKNTQIQKDIRIIKQNKKIIILSDGKNYVFDYKIFLSDYKKIFISISNKIEKNILKQTTLAGFLIFLPFLIPMYSALIPVSYTHLTLPTILLVQISVVAVSLKKKKNYN
eukprot:TRINITY_DN5677_c0_g1_i3.p4 TRINITY_DN5677_c0_g1~~TRINITY_DN5677_c0_g1_i3.p4  ORF type:complete len:127 (-),score=40.35 TRINITY_DN5677_c0_g1_i3:63-443(-)